MSPDEARAATVAADLLDMIARRPEVTDPQSFRRVADALRVAARSGQPLGSALTTRDYLSMPEAAAATSISVRSLRRHIASGALPAVTVGRRRLIRVTDLTTWLDRTEAA